MPVNSNTILRLSRKSSFIILICITILLAGCASKKVNPAVIGAKAFEEKGFSVIDIPSHGVIGDGLALAVGGGAYVTSVRDTLIDIQENETLHQVWVTSTNSLLAKTILSNALDDLEPGALDRIYLVFAGDVEHGADLRTVVESTGARYKTVVR